MTAEDFGEVALQLNDDELLAYLESEDADITDLLAEIEWKERVRMMQHRDSGSRSVPAAPYAAILRHRHILPRLGEECPRAEGPGRAECSGA